jgi:UDP-glucose 4-epimerase
MRNVVVTGQHGFIGKHLITYLTEYYTTHPLPYLPRIYHLAGIVGSSMTTNSIQTMIEVNMELMAAVLKKYPKQLAPRILFTSTNEVNYFTEYIDQPRVAYPLSKLACEALLYDSGLSHVILRLGNVYGEGMKSDYFIGSLCQRLLAGENPLIVKNPDDVRTFSYVGDVVAGLVRSMEDPTLDGMYAFGDWKPYAVLDIAEKLVAISGKKVAIQTAWTHARDDTELRTIRNGLPTFVRKVGIDEGLEKTYNWFADQAKLI